MNAKLVLLFLGVSLSGLAYAQTPATGNSKKVVLKDYGKDPLVLDIDDYTKANTNFRTALWTGTHLQLTVMSIPVGGEVGLEQHKDTDQFLRVEEGDAKIMMGDSKDALTFVKQVSDDFIVIIPAGKFHNIINTGDEPLKLYSIYAPVEHPAGTVHKTKKDADEQEKH